METVQRPLRLPVFLRIVIFVGILALQRTKLLTEAVEYLDEKQTAKKYRTNII